ncbi:hypothetical protein A2U01_0023826, partial [Trifolium medium]|nr:hypothetical protein [Trifolium medium]
GIARRLATHAVKLAAEMADGPGFEITVVNICIFEKNSKHYIHKIITFPPEEKVKSIFTKPVLLAKSEICTRDIKDIKGLFGSME